MSDRGTMHDTLWGEGEEGERERRRGGRGRREGERRGGDKIGREAGWVLIMICVDVPQPGVHAPETSNSEVN